VTGENQPGKEDGPSASPIRRLPSPCERRTESAEGLIREPT
jgi:hypothetical protein